MIIAGLLFCSITYSQSIIKNEVDQFTKQKRVETDDVVLVLTDESRLAVSLRSVGESYFITFIGYGHGPEVIGESGEAMILLENDSGITVKSTGPQTYALNYSTKSYRHQYSISKVDIKKLFGSSAKAIRRYGLKGYVDIDIEKKDELIKLSKVFLGAVGDTIF